MKKIITLVCCLFLGNNFYAQVEITQDNLQENPIAYTQTKNPDAQTSLEKSKATVKTVGVNATYMNNSVFTDNGNYVKILQQYISKYDVKNMEAYNNDDKSIYDVSFKTKKGIFLVTYKGDGQIISSKERYKNVIIPKAVSISIMKTYPNWIHEASICTVNYRHGKGLSTSYRVKISNGNQTKIIKTDAKGNII
ncbi:hypothetical protein [Formosa sp. PL04]|uniref:hypothetical protein n=1 Tax=Formosa sp. PL04 TaxID=3081755 RepID=UPI00298204C6|nr:hypothetical protein [Formosa sp. PL04]MDW5287603.1 hypothetical protein [Formosa sp. PL04]